VKRFNEDKLDTVTEILASDYGIRLVERAQQEIRLLRSENARLVEENKALKKSRANLADGLMDMVHQFFHDDGTGLCHSFMSAEENAIGALLDEGLATQKPGKKLRFFLEWEKLKQLREEAE
jgi:hypothetical protein